MDKELLERILQNDSVPTIPAYAMKVVELCGDPDVSLMEVGNLVQNDAATSAKLLRLANSSMFGLSREVSSVHHAVSVLGLSTVRMVTIATALVGGLEGRDVARLDRRSFWRGALITSLAAHKLAERMQAVHADQAFIAGLLQNLGVHVMAGALGDRYVDVLESVEDHPLALSKAEMDGFGLSHAEVGAQLLASWNFPASMVDAIQHHEDEDVTESNDGAMQLAAVLHVAESYRAAFLRPGPEQVTELLRRNRGLLGLDEEVTVEFLTFVEAHAAQVASTFDLDIGDSADIEDSRVKATSELVGLMLRAQDQNRSDLQQIPEGQVERRQDGGDLTGLTVFRVELDGGAEFAADVGDHAHNKVVETVTEIMRGLLRQTDLVLRWGSQGWVVVTPVGNEPIARSIAERLVNLVRAQAVRTSRGELSISVSVGAAWDPDCKSEGFQDLLVLSEQHLLKAIRSGGATASGAAIQAGADAPTPA